MNRRDGSHAHDGDAHAPDALAALRRAWDALTPPPRPDQLDAEDAATRAAVQWLQAGWDHITPPALAVPRDLAARRRAATRPPLEWRRVWRWRQLAAAALLLVVLGGPLLLSPGRGDTPALPDPGQAPTLAALPLPASPPAPTVVRADADLLELRSGPVRLLLLTADAP